jgi:uncharacterized ubiquitin-like protein YukD
MKNYMVNILALSAIFVLGCSNVTNYEQNINSFIVDQNLTPMVSIDSDGAIDFRALNDQNIALRVQNRDTYLVTTPDNCQDLQSATKVVIATRIEDVVQVNNKDKVIQVGDKYTECLITGIYKLNSDQLDQLVRWSYRRHPSRSNNLISPTFNDAKKRGISD